MTQRCRVFLATDLNEGPPQRDPEESDMRAAWFSRRQVGQMVADGTLADVKSLAALALLLSIRS